MSDQHPLVTLCEEAKPGEWIVAIRCYERAWKVEVDGDLIGAHPDLRTAAQSALDEFRTWGS